MPGYDKRGPMGEGPMTGGRWGRCANPDMAAIPSGYGGGDGRGMGFRRGFGRRRGRGFGPAYRTGGPLSKTDQIEMLRAEAEAMQHSLEAVRHKITELDKPENT